MPLTIGSNIASLQGQRRLFETERSYARVLEQLSTGQRINRASDDAAGFAIAESLRTDSRVYTQAIRNANDGISVLTLADSALTQLTDVVTRLVELASQAANGSFSNVQRGALNEEAQALRDEFFRVSRSVQFNGLGLFDGSLASGLRVQLGYGVNGSIQSGLGGKLGTGGMTSVFSNDDGSQYNATKLADLNGDGILDSVSADNGAGELKVAYGRGDGTFEDPAVLASAGAYLGVQLGDLNGDGLVDIVGLVNGGDGTVLLNNGSGGFTQSTLATGTNAIAGELGDINGDGNLDLVFASGSVQVMLGNGDGTFATRYEVLPSAGYISVALGDLNDDGSLDILAADLFASNLTYTLNNGSGGFGSFEQVIGITNAPLTIRTADINGDGSLDVLVGNSGTATIGAFLGDGTGGLSFSHDIELRTNGGEFFELGDVNGDGLLDIIATEGSELVTLLGDGGGNFSFSSAAAGSGVGAIALGDLNGDGVLDAFTASSGGRLESYLGLTREGLSPLLEFSLLTKSDALQSLAPLRAALSRLTAQRGVIGAFQSRLETALGTLQGARESFLGAESRIRDADIAQSTAELVRLQILRQATGSILSQANQQPALALQLLQ